MKCLSRFVRRPNQTTPVSQPVTACAMLVKRTLHRSVMQSERIDHDVFRKQWLLRLERMHGELQHLAEGRLVFDSTETWRSVYEDVLGQCQMKRYLSVALVQSEDYWRGLPGDRSIAFNGTLVQAGFYVHRFVIVDDFFWPKGAAVPSRAVQKWVTDQYARGIQIGLVRISELDDEPDLLVDFGIYGDTAVGYQMTDAEGHTKRFEMLFGNQAVRVAEDRWKRLSLYVQPFESL